MLPKRYRLNEGNWRKPINKSTNLKRQKEVSKGAAT